MHAAAFTLDGRVHLLESAESPALTTTLTEAEVETVFEGVNEVWSQAGIEWRIEAVVREEAENGEAFERMLRGEAPSTFQGVADVIPRANLAHELGHALSLPHVPCVVAGSLMAPGCAQGVRTRLDDSQIRAARIQAATGRPYTGGGPISWPNACSLIHPARKPSWAGRVSHAHAGDSSETLADGLKRTHLFEREASPLGNACGALRWTGSVARLLSLRRMREIRTGAACRWSLPSLQSGQP